jgi:folate-dependent phosphoribosylglycinamide formyltransferase PurN
MGGDLNLVFVTTASDMLGGVFARSYAENNGVPPSHIFVLGDRSDLAYPFWAEPLVAIGLFGVVGTLRATFAHYLRWTFRQEDKQCGLHLPWLATLAGENTELVYCRSINDTISQTQLREICPDLLISIGAPIIFKKSVISVPKIGAINVHNGALPKYRGHFGTFWELNNNERQACISIHKMERKVDTGGMIASECLAVDDFGNLLDILIKKKQLGGELLAQIVNRIAQTGTIQTMTDSGGAYPASDSYFGWPTLQDVAAFSRQYRVRRMKKLLGIR